MPVTRSSLRTLVVASLAGLGALGVSNVQDAASSRKPQIVLTARPLLAFTPAKIKFSADLRGGDDDYEEFYCAAVEWDWGDETTSESAADCEPYRTGVSQIRRHFTAEHTYDVADNYHPTFKLKKKDKVVGQAKTDIEVRPGRP